jgi:hypothetical protein
LWWWSQWRRWRAFPNWDVLSSVLFICFS